MLLVRRCDADVHGISPTASHETKLRPETTTVLARCSIVRTRMKRATTTAARPPHRGGGKPVRTCGHPDMSFVRALRRTVSLAAPFWSPTVSGCRNRQVPQERAGQL